MPFLRHDGITFHYLDSGEGVPFIFQHGLGGDVTQSYGLLTPPLPFRLLSFDFRGPDERQEQGVGRVPDPAKGAQTLAIHADTAAAATPV
jgi:pimeloyl-ACP methyl ester carboxylesterase